MIDCIVRLFYFLQPFNLFLKSDNIVRFSRLLRIFELNNNPAFIVELEENGQKTLYISYYDKKLNHHFKSYNYIDDTELKKEFINLSTYCLMSQCTNASSMFYKSHITHFEADCSSLIYGRSMFAFSSLCFIKTEFPKLKEADFIFCATKIKEFKINLPELKTGGYMLADSSLEKITSQFSILENGEFMFYNTKLKNITSQFPKLENETGMFDGTPPELKQNHPYYFA